MVSSAPGLATALIDRLEDQSPNRGDFRTGIPTIDEAIGPLWGADLVGLDAGNHDDALNASHAAAFRLAIDGRGGIAIASLSESSPTYFAEFAASVSRSGNAPCLAAAARRLRELPLAVCDDVHDLLAACQEAAALGGGRCRLLIVVSGSSAIEVHRVREVAAEIQAPALVCTGRNSVLSACPIQVACAERPLVVPGAASATLLEVLRHPRRRGCFAAVPDAELWKLLPAGTARHDGARVQMHT